MGLFEPSEDVCGELARLESNWISVIIASSPASVVASGDCYVAGPELPGNVAKRDARREQL